MNARMTQRMTRGWKLAIYAIFGALWLSGGVWWALHGFFEKTGDFGAMPHPWEPPVLHLHGLLAVPGVFLLGWLLASHMAERWRQRQRVASGLTLAVTAAVLTVAGYALYYTTGRLHEASSLAHESLGLAAILVALIHWARI